MYDNTELDYTYLQTLSARSTFANISLTMIEIGIGILILVSQSSSAVYTTALVYESAYAFLTVSTNLLITSLISFYLLNERRKFFAFLPPKELKMYTGVVAVLIESGLPLTIFGIVYAASLVVDPAKGSPEGANERYAANFVMFDIFGYLFYAFTVSRPEHMSNHTIILADD
ncbi:hypothetical protein H1R20_g15747, partial [Candolleomyces eurysporus]